MAQTIVRVGERVGTFNDGHYAVLVDLHLKELNRDTVTLANNLNTYVYMFRKESSDTAGAFFDGYIEGEVDVLSDPYTTPNDPFMSACDAENVTVTI